MQWDVGILVVYIYGVRLFVCLFVCLFACLFIEKENPRWAGVMHQGPITSG